MTRWEHRVRWDRTLVVLGVGGFLTLVPYKGNTQCRWLLDAPVHYLYWPRPNISTPLLLTLTRIKPSLAAFFPRLRFLQEIKSLGKRIMLSWWNPHPYNWNILVCCIICKENVFLTQLHQYFLTSNVKVSRISTQILIFATSYLNVLYILSQAQGQHLFKLFFDDKTNNTDFSLNYTTKQIMLIV